MHGGASSTPPRNSREGRASPAPAWGVLEPRLPCSRRQPQSVRVGRPSLFIRGCDLRHTYPFSVEACRRGASFTGLGTWPSVNRAGGAGRAVVKMALGMACALAIALLVKGL